MNFNFTLPTTPSNGTGILFYTLNTREGYQGYRIEINGQGGNSISLPSGSHFATLHTVVEPLRQTIRCNLNQSGQPVRLDLRYHRLSSSTKTDDPAL